MGKFANEIKAYALKNAIEFGKVDAGRILPKLFQHGLEKNEVKSVMPEIVEIVGDVNRISKTEREKLFGDFKKFIKEKEEKERGLPELPNAVEGKVVLRLAPYPSGAMHIGNARTYMLNAMYAEKYKGKLLLVMDDTIGSAEKQIAEESYQLIEDAFAWLGVTHYGDIIYKSDRLEIYYEYAEKLIQKDKAYVCHCVQEQLRNNRVNGMACGCRMLPKNIQMLRWKEMFKMKEGHATLRIKTDMLHPNPAFRDRVLFKISDRAHPRVGNKYRVWPTLEMNWAIDDHLLGVTHIVRGNDLMIESDMEKYIWDIFGWKYPELMHVGLVQFEGIKLSKSKSQQEVISGAYVGWHDPRTWSLQSLGFRGIKPEAIIEFIKEVGFSKQDITVPIDNLYAINRKMIDNESNRYSFIVNPMKLSLKGVPDWKTISVPLHPDRKEAREISVGDIYISKVDYEKYKQQEIRLIHLCNVNLKVGQVTSVENKNINKITWVSKYVLAKVFMPDGEWINGFADEGIESLEVGQVIQFERFGFVRLDAIKEEEGKKIYEFWFAHK